MVFFIFIRFLIEHSVKNKYTNDGDPDQMPRSVASDRVKYTIRSSFFTFTSFFAFLLRYSVSG